MNISQDSNKKKSSEHQALQISKFGINQAIKVQPFKTLKTYQENCLDIYNNYFYQILEIFIGCILFNILAWQSPETGIS